jgi:hypothetical protein
MHGLIHTDMALKVISQDANALAFLLNGVSKPRWKTPDTQKETWLKEWMDSPDHKGHQFISKNDHSYKLDKEKNKFVIRFIKKRADQGTVVERLKLSVRQILDWKTEEEYRICSIELAKSIHWIVDVTSPPHTSFGWEEDENNGKNLHCEIESDFDNEWKKLLDLNKTEFGRANEIKDIYKWAKALAESRYDRNIELLKLYRANKSIKKPEGKKLAQDVIQDIAQNIADYLAFIDKKIKFNLIIPKLKENG